MDQFAQGETGKPWTTFEIEASVGAYLEMLRMERTGLKYTKADVVRGLEVMLPARSHTSIERKFQNISAVLDQIDHPWIDGYKPLPNYQRDLRDAVLGAVRRDHRLGEALAAYATSPLVAPQHKQLATADVLVSAPGGPTSGSKRSAVNLVAGPVRALGDFQAKQLGDAGEEWVVDLEREDLARRGRLDLAERVIWTAREIGDGAGYDVASFYPDGRERLIEVKTTNYGARTPFYITRWEVEFSRIRADAFSLYRVHGFARDPKIYVLDGSVAERARLEPKVYLGIPI